MTYPANPEPAMSSRRKLFVGAGIITVLIAGVVLLRGGPVVTVDASIPAGTSLVAELRTPVSTEGEPVGTIIHLETVEPVPLEDGRLLPAGLILRGEVVHARAGDGEAGTPELSLGFTEIEVDGTEYELAADPLHLRAEVDTMAVGALRSGERAEADGVAAADQELPIIDDAAVGEGDVLSTGAVIATEGDQLVVETGQLVRIRLAESLTMRVASTMLMAAGAPRDRL